MLSLSRLMCFHSPPKFDPGYIYLNKRLMTANPLLNTQKQLFFTLCQFSKQSVPQSTASKSHLKVLFKTMPNHQKIRVLPLEIREIPCKKACRQVLVDLIDAIRRGSILHGILSGWEDARCHKIPRQCYQNSQHWASHLIH